MKKILIMAILGLAMLASCLPVPAQTPIYHKLGASVKMDRDVVLEATNGIKNILCANVWSVTGAKSKLVFAADNVYKISFPWKNDGRESYDMVGKWSISPTVLTIVIDKYPTYYTILNVTPKVLTLLGYDNCPIYLTSQ